ncbi:MAG TPA: hypothetical protein VF690_16630 [Hymenobacter sp.]
MTTLSAPVPPARPGGSGWWGWLLRALGLDAGFQQKPVASRAGREERVFLLIGLPANSGANAALLAEALSECMATIRASGGEVAGQKNGNIWLAWPAGLGERQAIAVYFQLHNCLRRRSHPAELLGAAGLGWVKPGRAWSGLRYRGDVLGSVAGILRESQQVGGLLVSAALRQRVDRELPFRYELHVGFNLPGHSYPATLYRVAPEALAADLQPHEPIAQLQESSAL